MRISKAITTVEDNWNINLLSDLPSEIRPSHLSRHLAEAIAKFSHTVPYNQALPLFHSAIKTQLNTPWSGKRNTSYLLKQDVDRAYQETNLVQSDSMTDITMSSSATVSGISI